MLALSLPAQLLLGTAVITTALLSPGLLFVTVPISRTNFAVCSALLVGVLAVTLNFARNARPTDSLGKMLYDI